MSRVEPKTVVEDWAHLSVRHLLQDLAGARTVVIDRPNSMPNREPQKGLAEPVFIRPAAQTPRWSERLRRRLGQREASRRELAGVFLLAVALCAVALHNRYALEGEPVSGSVTISDPLPSESSLQQAVISRLQDRRRRREERLARVERAAAAVVQEQRERFVAARAKEEAIAQIRGRRPDPELLARLRAAERADLEDRASASLASGARTEALALYRALHAADPRSAIYAAFVRVLDEQTQCERDQEEAGASCL